MPLVGAALVPNSPLFLPGLAHEVTIKTARTQNGLDELKKFVKIIHPKIVLIMAVEPAWAKISSYALLQGTVFSYNFHTLGDLHTQGMAKGTIGFTHRLKELAETSFPMPQINSKILPTNFAIPWALLNSSIAECSVACLGLPEYISTDKLAQISVLIGDYLSTVRERVLLIGAGMLGHQSENNSSEVRVFDQVFRSACQENSLATLLNLNPDIQQHAKATLWSPAIHLFSMLKDNAFTCTIASYEVTGGVGALTAKLVIA